MRSQIEKAHIKTNGVDRFYFAVRPPIGWSLQRIMLQSKLMLVIRTKMVYILVNFPPLHSAVSWEPRFVFSFNFTIKILFYNVGTVYYYNASYKTLWVIFFIFICMDQNCHQIKSNILKTYVSSCLLLFISLYYLYLFFHIFSI